MYDFIYSFALPIIFGGVLGGLITEILSRIREWMISNFERTLGVMFGVVIGLVIALLII